MAAVGLINWGASWLTASRLSLVRLNIDTSLALCMNQAKCSRLKILSILSAMPGSTRFGDPRNKKNDFCFVFTNLCAQNFAIIIQDKAL